MTDYTHTPIGSGYNTASQINTELSGIEAAIDSKLDSDGGFVTAPIDMNSQKLLNLPDGTQTGDSVNYGQLVNRAAFQEADAKFYDTVLLATSDSTLNVGDVVVIKDRANGKFDVVTVGITPNVDLPNGFNIIVSTVDTTKCLVLRYDGVANLSQWGFSEDGVTSDREAMDNLLSLAPANTKIVASGTSINFGAIAGDATLFTVDKDLVFDWNGAELICAGDNTGSFTDTCLFKFEDVKVNFYNYIFNDTAFNLALGPSRGVAPIIINNIAANTSGHSVGPMHVISGQSLLTCASGTPDTYRARGITLVGSCTADSVYYGVNCARNGDTLRGSYNITSCNRAYFAYGVKDHDVRFRVETGQPASANLFISHANSATAANNTDTQDIKVSASFGTLDGGIVIADQPRDLVTGAGIYKNIDIKVAVDSIGSNLQNGATNNFPLVKIGAFDTNGAFITTETSQTIQNLKVKLLPSITINTHGKLTNPVLVSSPSPNYGEFSFPLSTQAGTSASVFPENLGGDTFRVPTIKSKDWFYRVINGALTDGAGAVTRTLYMPLRYIAPRQRNSVLAIDLQVVAYRNTTSGVVTMSDYYIVGSIASTGAITVTSAHQKATRSTGGITPTITIAAADPYSTGVNDHISITLVDSSGAGGYNASTAQLVCKVRPTI